MFYKLYLDITSNKRPLGKDTNKINNLTTCLKSSDSIINCFKNYYITIISILLGIIWLFTWQYWIYKTGQK